MATTAAQRIEPREVIDRLQGGEHVYFVDSRNETAYGEAETKLPEAVRVPAGEVEKHLADMPRDRTIVTYCT